MNNLLRNLSIFALFLTATTLFAADKLPPVKGMVSTNGEPIPFATIAIASTTLGTASDDKGVYTFSSLPEGHYTIIAQAVGYKAKEVEIDYEIGKNLVINFDLAEDVLGLEQVVVTADKHQKKRVNASMVVNTMTPKTFSQTQSVTLSEGLSFTPGIRTENNCQNCGANSVRMNGMEGSYSQVLINGKQIFSGLASVYGLEMIPANMIEQVEVVKGGGSALYGSNAIAGTINLITKEPTTNTFEAGINNGIIGVGKDGAANDLNINLNTSIVTEDKNTGMSLYGSHRNREGFDYNGDGFTELAELNNVTLGTSVYHRMGYRDKITFDYFHIQEDRRGGDQLDLPKHEAEIAEAVEHKINTGAINYTRFVGENNGQLSVYASAQHIDRGSYYGAEKDPSGYGHTTDLSYAIGTQYKADYGKSNLVAGIENNGSKLNDKKLAYTYFDEESGTMLTEDTRQVSKQNSNIWGAFGQYEYAFNKLTLSGGLRVDYYDINNEVDSKNDLDNVVVSPRLNALYSPSDKIRIRGSYSQGYRAPQIFDEDLHIESSAARKVVHVNGDNLEQETSHSMMASFDYHSQIGSGEFEFLVEGFYTYLENAFVLDHGAPDEDGVALYTRFNSDVPARVKGINFELRYAPSIKFDFNGGYTFQSSQFDEEQEYNDAGTLTTKEFLRTPNNYGFFTLNYKPTRKLTLSANATHTGSMNIAYFGPELENPEEGELRTTDQFFDLGLKAEYTLKSKSGVDVAFSAGIKNIFNSYQSDLDTGVNRDPAYMYGPQMPRTVYFGIKIGNLL